MSKQFIQFKTLDGVTSPTIEASLKPGMTMIRPMNGADGFVMWKELPSGGSIPKIREYRCTEVAQLFLFEEVEAGEA